MGNDMRIFEITTAIESTPSRIWELLVDFGRYHEWNSVVPVAAGTATPGTRLRLQIRGPSGHLVRFSPSVIEVRPEEELALSAAVIHPRIVFMRHRFILQPVDAATVNLVQGWTCSGLLVVPLWSRLVAGMRPFATFGDDLRRTVEQR